VTWTLSALDDSTTLLTVNNRLAAELRGRFDRAQAAAGRRVWPSPDILPWNAWLRRHYEHLLDAGRVETDLLSPAQERLVWQAVIERHSGTGGLLRPAAAAQSAFNAYALLADWQLDRFALETLGGEDTRTFLLWRQTFEDELRRRGLLSAAGLLPLIRSAFADGALTVPQCLAHSGFDALSPAQQALFELLGERGCTIIEHREPGAAGRRRRVEAPDSEAEIRLAAAWTQQQLQQDPQRRIGIVSPQITQQRRDLERIFNEVLCPQTYLLLDDSPRPFNISLGTPLADCPLVAHALLALELLQGEQPLHQIGQLLRSPFIGRHAAEWEGRGLLDVALREDGLPHIDLRRLRYRQAHFDPADPRRCPDLLHRLERFAELQHTLPTRDTPNAWAGHLQRLLGVLGWPGDRALDSHEYQQHERLQRLFSELAELGKVRPQMRQSEALSQLRALAKDTMFQAESAHTPVQILGPLEAAGMDFDAVWLLGMHDQVWPPTPHPEPLLPCGLQRQLGMPHASAARELAFATALTERLADSATELIASHAHSDADREQRVSPLLLDWPLVDAAQLVTTAPDLRAICAAAQRLEPLPDAAAGPAPGELRGGAALLAAQASCPFQAVARYRLSARPLEEASFAADGALLGSLVHELLQRVWQTLRDSATLAAHDEAGLQALIEPLATATLEDLGRRRPDLFTPRFRALECTRLTRLLIEWLGVERARERPFAVSALEQDQVVDVAGLRLTTRADRVDRLADGSLAIIDYKTGRRVSDDGWFDERLSEPQLPLYCLHGDGQVGAVLLARVRRDDRGCRFVGLSRREGVAPGVGTPQQRDEALDWPGILAHWRRALDGLGREIAAGRADPTPSAQACQYCPLGALCRVQEMLREGDDD